MSKPATHRHDAELILAVLRATAAWEGDTQSDAVVRPIRDLLWAVWEKPRLGPVVRRRYPIHALWSRAARDAYEADPAVPLVLEHVTPVNVIVRDLLRRPPATVASLTRTLNRRIEHTVLTREENQMLGRARVATKLPEGSRDGWDRYRVAGLNVRGFRQLDR